jgi:hypothetical protein
LVAVVDGSGIFTCQSTYQSIPALNLSVSPGGGIVSWPFAAADYTLQQNANLTTTSWTPVTAAPTFINLKCAVAVSLTNGSQFYRLESP